MYRDGWKILWKQKEKRTDLLHKVQEEIFEKFFWLWCRFFFSMLQRSIGRPSYYPDNTEQDMYLHKASLSQCKAVTLDRLAAGIFITAHTINTSFCSSSDPGEKSSYNSDGSQDTSSSLCTDSGQISICSRNVTGSHKLPQQRCPWQSHYTHYKHQH